MQDKSGTKRSNIKIGGLVDVVEKQNQGSEELTRGLVKRILTKSSSHPHGIKVLLDTGEIGRVKVVLPDE